MRLFGRSPRWRWVIVIGVVLAASGLLVTHILTWRSLQATEADLADTRATTGQRRLELASTDQAVEAEEALLDAAVDELDAAIALLQGLRRDLDQRTNEWRELLRRLAETRAQLGSLQEDITALDSELAVQAAEMVSLRTCLGGVTRALTLVSFNDQAGALANLDRVSDPCRSSSVLLSVGG